MVGSCICYCVSKRLLYVAAVFPEDYCMYNGYLVYIKSLSSLCGYSYLLPMLSRSGRETWIQPLVTSWFWSCLLVVYWLLGHPQRVGLEAMLVLPLFRTLGHASSQTLMFNFLPNTSDWPTSHLECTFNKSYFTLMYIVFKISVSTRRTKVPAGNPNQ